MPCSTRPATSTPMVGARPATASPVPKKSSPATNGTAGPRRSASRPASTMPITLPSMNALNTQPYRRRPPRSWAATGITVTTASASDATKVIDRTRPAVSPRVGGAQSPRTRPSLIRRPTVPPVPAGLPQLCDHVCGQALGVLGLVEHRREQDQSGAGLDDLAQL